MLNDAAEVGNQIRDLDGQRVEGGAKGMPIVHPSPPATRPFTHTVHRPPTTVHHPPHQALVDAYEVDGVVYMMLATSNAVKFDQVTPAGAPSPERRTCEAIVESFRIGRA